MSKVLEIIKNRQLTHEQKIMQLAREAENSIVVFQPDAEIQEFMHNKIICDLAEGNAPFRPRYILPDYEKFMVNGSKFLALNPPQNLFEAINNLLILYRHVPSITNYPVYLGNLDTLLNPYINNEEEAYQLIKMFLTNLDRTLTDSFVHANIGPHDTVAGRLILRAERELVNAVPNLSLKYNNETPDDFAIEAVLTGLKAAKPYFANHDMFVSDFGEKYGIASCYNGLPVGGGSYTLIRMNLKNLAVESAGLEDFLRNKLPVAVKAMCRLMDMRIKFLVEESGFFESNFLVQEGLLEPDRFLAMFGIHGLAECVNHLIQATSLKQQFGHNQEANLLGEQIIALLDSELGKHHNAHCKISNGKFLLHAQCGIGSDIETSPGCRIPAGKEPETFEQIMSASLYHKYFPTGISDVFTFDSTSEKNPQFVLDIAKGAMKAGLRLFAFYTKDSDLIRITGYLVKRSEMEKYGCGCQNLHDTVALGEPTVKSLNVDKRKKITESVL